MVSSEIRIKNLGLPNIFGYCSVMLGDKASSADNQQERLHLLNSDEESSETTCQISSCDESLSKLLGMLYTDGCVSPRHKSSWRIYFSSSSFTLIREFRRNIRSVFGLDLKRVRISKVGNRLWKAVVDSGEIGSFLVDTFGTFRTLNFCNGGVTDAKLPISYLERGRTAVPFLRSAFSCDGGVCFYAANTNKGRFLIRNVFLACSHDGLRRDYHHLLKMLGISSLNDCCDKKVKITGRGNIIAFRDVIGFIAGVRVTKHSKCWCNTQKNEVLKALIESYDNPRKYLSFIDNHK
ncbi:MAG: hypothetical protein KatS3mg101_0559 [Patescibacteria group bacterium]|nr:MAG: hypothetical protein KatS3mg101_0559 [Patescibacteria group bacterium]